MKQNNEQEINWIFKDKYNEKWSPKILEDIRRYQAGEPIDYIIGWKSFLNCKIDLSLKPLIPRPETEYWTEQAIKKIKNPMPTGRQKKSRQGRGSPEAAKIKIKVLDIFAGSGCIGIAILKNTQNTTVDFAEIDPRLIKQIKINLKINQIQPKRAKIIRSDIFSALRNNPRQWRGKYDFILANPPYITSKRKIQKAVLQYEPHLALLGKKDGVFYIKKFLKGTREHLNSKGQIWMEFSPEQKSALAKIIKKSSYQNWQFHKDQYKRWRYVVVTKR